MEAPDVDQLLANDPGRRSVVTLACMAASVAAVVTVLSLPSWLAAGTDGPGRPLPPAPAAREQTIGARSWTALECPGEASRCQVPSLLTLGGARFDHVASHTQPVRQGDVASRTLVATVGPGTGPRWLLVGALGASSASALSVRLGSEDAADLLPGTLTFLPVPGDHERVQVTISDYGRAGAGEQLRVEEYDAQG